MICTRYSPHLRRWLKCTKVAGRAGIGCIECKGWAADALVQILNPIQERRATFTEPQVKEILEAGSERAAARAEQTMDEVYGAMKMSLTAEVKP